MENVLAPLSDLMMSSQFLLLALLPATAVIVSLAAWRRLEKILALLAVGLWFECIGVYALAFPLWVSYEQGGMLGSGVSEVSRFLSSVGVLGHSITILTIGLIAYFKLRAKEKEG